MGYDMTQPHYYKALWHNCNSCHIHYMSEHPHIRAYLCDECWTKLPHYKVGKPQRKQTMNKKEEKWSPYDYMIYTWACLIVISFTVGYMLLR
jgi:hypothetical protein